MPDYRRYYVPNASIFITVVTHERRHHLGPMKSIELFWETIMKVQEIHPFEILAYTILPDHFHWLIRVDNREGDYSIVMHRLKRNFSVNYKKLHSISTSFTVWQKRFWDHVIRDENDFGKHLNYIHWNPIKHRFVARPEDWEHSSRRPPPVAVSSSQIVARGSLRQSITR